MYKMNVFINEAIFLPKVMAKTPSSKFATTKTSHEDLKLLLHEE